MKIFSTKIFFLVIKILTEFLELFTIFIRKSCTFLIKSYQNFNLNKNVKNTKKTLHHPYYNFSKY